jgi:hypothetical protein
MICLRQVNLSFRRVLSAGLSLPEGIICWTVIVRGYYLLDCHCPRVVSAGLSLLEGIICWTVIARGYYPSSRQCFGIDMVY